MTDKKLIAAIVKKLERAIGILDNCSETGEISEATRRRVIEMLNTATMDVYYIDKQLVGSVNELTSNVELPNIRVAPEPSIEVEEFREQLKEIVLAPNVHAEAPFSAMRDIVGELEHERELSATKSTIDNDKLAAEVTAAFNAPTAAEAEEVTAPQVDETAHKEELEQVEEQSGITPIYQEYFAAQTKREKEEQEEQKIEVAEEEAFNASPSTATVIEQATDSRPTSRQEPLLELEMTPFNMAVDSKKERTPVALTEVEDPAVALERKQLEGLRLQLELERTRLEAELQNWQTEKMKRDEEMRAAEKLLAALAAEELRRKTVLEQKRESQEPAPTAAVASPHASLSQTPVQPGMVEPRTMVPPQPIAAKPAEKEQGTLIEKFLGSNKKFVHDNFENDDLRTQGFTAILDLSKAIGINDKFQFIKELFGGDSDLYAETINTLNNRKSMEDVNTYIDANFNWDKNSDTVKRLILLLRRRYM